jgi:hypothetical protein
LSRNAFMSMMEWFGNARKSISAPPPIKFKEGRTYWAEEFFFDRVLGDDFITQTIQNLERPFLHAGWLCRKRLEIWPKDPWYIFTAFLFVVDLKRHPPEENMILCDIVEQRFVKKAADGRFVCQVAFRDMPFKTLLMLKLSCTLETNFHLRRKRLYNNSLFDGETCNAVRSIFHQMYEDLSFLLSKQASDSFSNGLAEVFKKSGDDILLFRTTFHEILTATAIQVWDIVRSSPDNCEVCALISLLLKDYEQLIGQVEHQKQSSQNETQKQAISYLLNVITHTKDNLLALKKVFGDI